MFSGIDQMDALSILEAFILANLNGNDFPNGIFSANASTLAIPLRESFAVPVAVTIPVLFRAMQYEGLLTLTVGGVVSALAGFVETLTIISTKFSFPRVSVTLTKIRYDPTELRSNMIDQFDQLPGWDGVLVRKGNLLSNGSRE